MSALRSRTVAEEKQRARMRVGGQLAPAYRRQAIDAATKIDGRNGDQNFHMRDELDHTAAISAGSADQSTD